MNTEERPYYIIGKEYPRSGLFALYIWICAQIIYAKQQGYIPVVDMKHYKNQFFKDNREYQDNVWEYFFEQPEGIGLDDIPKGAKIIMAGDSVPDIEYLWAGLLPKSKNDQKNPKIADKYIKYLKLKNEIKEYLINNYQQITEGNTNILGILCRGTDYINMKPQDHPIQPTVDEVMAKADELYQTFKYDKIYLATEDAEIYKIFKNKYKDKLLFNKQYMYSNTENKYLYEITVNQKDHKYILNRDYFLSMYILSKCKYFIGGLTSGTVAVYMLSNKFENHDYIYLWDKGVYNKAEKYPIISKILYIKNKCIKYIKNKLNKILNIKSKK